MKIKIVVSLLWLCLFLIVVNFLPSAKVATDMQPFSKGISLAIFAIMFAFISCFWVFVLTDRDFLLGWIRQFVSNLANGKYCKHYDLIMFATKPFYSCELCTTANFSFWLYLISHRKEFILIDCIFVMSLATFTTILTRKLWQK